MLNRNVKVWHILVVMVVLVAAGAAAMLVTASSDTPGWQQGYVVSPPLGKAYVVVTERNAYNDVIDAVKHGGKDEIRKACMAAGPVRFTVDPMRVLQVDGDFARVQTNRGYYSAEGGKTLMDVRSGWTKMGTTIPESAFTED